MKKLLTLFALMLVCIGQAFAYDFEVDGIYYDKSGGEATVTYANLNFNSYSGIVSIPATVAYDGVTYNVTSIRGGAFCVCSGLTSVTIPNSVQNIGGYAFQGCSGLTSVTIPNSVQSIGIGAFDGCSKLEFVVIPASVAVIESSVFSGCKSLQFISVSKENKYFTAEEGVLFSIDKKRLIQCPVAKVGSYDIPASVTSIGDHAFSDCSGLTSVTIPNSVTSIGSWAFTRSGLTSVTIPNSVKTIGDGAFQECNGLTEIVVPGSVKEIPEQCFRLCESLSNVTLGYGVMSIEDNAIADCSSLTSVTIPNSVTSIGKYAFDGCSDLTSINIPNSMISIGVHAFSGCSRLTSVAIPNSVTSIGGCAFYGCSGLTSIIVGGNNSTYDSRDNCNAIIETSSNTLIQGCKNTFIPNSVTSIGGHAFYGCTGLTSVTIPGSVTSIGGYAFYGCTGLTSVTNKAQTPQTIGNSTFSKYGTLHIMEGSKSRYASADYWKNFTIVEDVPPVKVTAIELEKNTYSIDEGESVTATVVSILPSDATNKEITWSSSYPYVAYVGSKTGQIVGLQDGIATITATAVDGSGVSVSAEVRVGEVYKYTVLTNDARMGSVTESGYCVGGVGTTISAVPNEGYEFVKWQYSYDGSDVIQEATTSTISNFLPDADVTFTAIFQEKANTEVSGLANTIYLEPFSAVYGQTVEVSVRMKNSIAATGFQFNMYLPEGVSVVKDADDFCDVSLSTARTTAIKTNTFDASIVNDGSLMVLAASTKNNTFSGSDGEVVRLKLAVSKDLPEGEYPIVFKNIEITDASGTPYRVAYLKTNMSVTSYRLGDVNADGSISVADFSAIASHIMENTPTGFVEQAADVNEDGYVTVSDLSSLVPIIIAESTGGASHSPRLNVRSKVKTDISGKDNIIYASDVTVAPGKDFTVSFNMKNLETAMTGFQYNVTLPEGITVCKDGDGFLEASLSTARTTTAKTNTFDASIVSDGTLMVLAASTKNFTFSGTDGEVVTVKMHADENLAAGTYDLSIDRIELTDDKGTPFRPGEAVVSAITVKAPQALTEVDFDFTDPASLGITPAAEIDDVVDITAPITKGAVTATVDGGVEVTIDTDAYILEIDRAGVLTLSTTAPGKIVKVEFGDDADAYIDKLSATTGELDGFVWTGSEEEVVFEVADTRNAVADITTIKVWLEGGEAPAEDLTFTDGEAYTATAAATYGKVTYTRTFDNTNWQALYVPFSMDYDEWSEKYDIAEIHNFIEYDDDDNGTFDRTYLVVLKKTSGSTEPNYPYLIRAKETGTHSLVLSDKTLEAAESNSIDCRSVKNEYTFTGTYTTVTDMYANQYWALSGGALNKANAAGVTLNPQRWYMALTSRTGASSTKAQSIRILVDGEEGIETPSNSPEGGDPVAYDLMGRMVSVKDNVRGVNIVNGKKLIK